ncbi:MAG: hypothetical protein INQ03_21130 [Candidatus Heimdallarchaeota archaeon]|nr:hypothetical protein [Candidatus Heimdallarchaeota archaeon]
MVNYVHIVISVLGDDVDVSVFNNINNALENIVSRSELYEDEEEYEEDACNYQARTEIPILLNRMEFEDHDHLYHVFSCDKHDNCYFRYELHEIPTLDRISDLLCK